MKRIAILAVLALCCAAGYAQNLIHPVGAADGGGGTSSGGGWTLLGSAGQAAAGSMAHLDTGRIVEGGIIPPLREGSGATHTASVLALPAWNMLSIPVIPPDPAKTTLIPTAVSAAYIYLAPPVGYISEDTLLPGVGFWAKFTGVQTLTFAGTGVTLDTLGVSAGWNLIGTLSYPLLAGDVVPLGGVTILSPYYAFVGGIGYTPQDTLQPGLAYWVKVSQTGEIVLESGSLIMSPSAGPPVAREDAAAFAPGGTAAQIPGGTGTLGFRDAAGQARDLYVAPAVAKILPDAYELPPLPPGGLFDVRYASQRVLETFGTGGTASKGAPVVINGAAWPVEISYSGGPESGSVTLLVRDAAGERSIDLAPGGTLTLERQALVSVSARNSAAAEESLPAEYRLYQNHPNPFNPATRVTFDLPEAARVTLLLTNSLGQTVVKVLDGEMEAGRHVVGIDGTALPTGVYFYRLTAGNFSDVKKMLLMK